MIDYDLDGRSDVLTVAKESDVVPGGDPSKSVVAVLVSRGTDPSQHSYAPLMYRHRDFNGQLVTEPIPAGLETDVADGATMYRGLRVVDFDNDGLDDILLIEGPGRDVVLYQRAGARPDVITKAVSGTDTARNYTAVTYAPIGASGQLSGDKPLYEYSTCLSAGCAQITANGGRELVRKGVTVVSGIETDSGLDDATGAQISRRFQYRYSVAMRDVESGSFLGFEAQVVEDLDRRALTTTEYEIGSTSDWWFDHYGFVKAGRPTTVVATTPTPAGVTPVGINQRRIEYTYDVRTYDNGQTIAVLPITIVESVHDARGPCPKGERQTETAFTYTADAFSNVDTKTVTRRTHPQCASNNHPAATETTFDSFQYYPPDESNWQVANLAFASTTRSLHPLGIAGCAADPSICQSHFTTYDYYFQGDLLSEEVMLGDPSMHRKTTYGRRADGVVESVTLEADDVPSRTTETISDVDGLPVRTVNALGHATDVVADPGSGAIVWSRDPNGRVTRTYVDGYFRPRRIDKPTLDDVTISYSAPSGTGSIMSVITQVTGGMTTVVEPDRAGRTMRTSTLNTHGKWTVVQRRYDLLGRLIVEDVPYEVASIQNAGNSPNGATTFTHDELDRVVRTIRADEKELQTLYCDNRAVTIDAEQRSRYEVRDDLDRTIEVGTGGTTCAPVANPQGRRTFTHAPDGQVRTVTDSAGNVMTMEYDDLGRRTKLVDPDTGTTSYTYNGFGELVTQTPLGQAVRRTDRDVLGRVVARTTGDGVTTFHYDDAPNGIGLLGGSTSFDGTTVGYTYTSEGLPEKQTWTVADQTNLATGQPVASSYSLRTTYDQSSRPYAIEYPTVNVGGIQRQVAVRYEYAPNTGAIADVSDVAGSTSYWHADERDELGRRTRERVGDVTTSRTYHPLTGRLLEIDSVHSSLGVIQALRYDYDAMGNLVRRADKIGATTYPEWFEYDEQERLKTWYAPATALGDDRRGAERTGPRAWTVAYAVDDIGNLTNRTLSDGVGSVLERVQVTYPNPGAVRPHAATGVQWLVGGGDDLSFTNDVLGRRSGISESGRPDRVVDFTTFDLPRSAHEAGEIVNPASTTTFLYDGTGTRVFKSAGRGTASEQSTTYVGGLYERRANAGSVEHVFYVTVAGRAVAQISLGSDGARTRYFHEDHLGSVHTITDDIGSVTVVRHDPFGNRYALDGLPRARDGFMGRLPGVTKGFTQHEMEDNLGWINMNGRIFDPLSGRFLSADPMRDGPNPYAYAAGNPLRYVDLAGFSSSDVTFQQPQPSAKVPDFKTTSNWDIPLPLTDNLTMYDWLTRIDPLIKVMQTHSTTMPFDEGGGLAAPDSGDRGDMAKAFDAGVEGIRLGVGFNGGLVLAGLSAMIEAPVQSVDDKGAAQSQGEGWVAGGTAGGRVRPNGDSVVEGSVEGRSRAQRSTDAAFNAFAHARPPGQVKNVMRATGDVLIDREFGAVLSTRGRTSTIREGDRGTFDFRPSVAEVGGSKNVAALFHSHTADSGFGVGGAGISFEDKAIADRSGKPIYSVNPFGEMWVYEPAAAGCNCGTLTRLDQQ